MTYNKNYQVDSAEVYCSIHSVVNTGAGISNFVLAALSNGEVIPECFFGGTNNRTHLYYHDKISIDKEHEHSIDIDQAYLSHIVYWGNFYHFMLELFPNLYYYSKNLMSSGVKLIIPDTNLLILELLDVLNIPESLVIVGEPKCLYRINKLHYSSTKTEPGDTQSQIDAFRHLQSAFTDIDCASSPERLYISRQDKKNKKFNNSANSEERKIINDDDVLQTIKKFNYDTQTVGTKSFYEKAKLLSRTRHIVTPHGGNILNCCLAKNLETITILTCKHALFCDNIFEKFIRAMLPNTKVIFVKGDQPENPNGEHLYSRIPFNVPVSELEESLQNEHDAQI
tara:strand:- start:723 stop:1739 length:1017 start_codon:yes stop_codon:yes gene_type:complete